MEMILNPDPVNIMDTSEKIRVDCYCAQILVTIERSTSDVHIGVVK